MKKYLILISLVALASLTFSQEAKPDSTVNNPNDIYEQLYSTKNSFGVGFGIGLPYGVLGGKLFKNHHYFQEQLGIGIIPLLWEPVISGSFSFRYPDINKIISPKLTFTATSCATFIYLYDQDNMTTLYQNKFAGFGVYGGMEVRLPGQNILIDANIGYIGPFVDDQEVIDDYNNALNSIRNRGYAFETEDKIKPSGIKASVGLLFNF